MDNIDTFINEYEALCRKHGLYIDLTTLDEQGIFELDKEDNMQEFECILQDWRED